MSMRRFGSLIVVVAMLTLPLLAACGAESPTAQASPSPATSTSPSAAPLTCTSSGPASASWIPPDKVTGTTPPIVSAAISGDILTLTFVSGTPAFEVTTQPNAQFTATDGRGETVVLSGSSGVGIILRGFRGDMRNYAGTTDMMATGKTLVEVREIGDYEGVVGWAAGLGQAGCANVAAGASTLTFTFFAS
jgi:hypothetical protein